MIVQGTPGQIFFPDDRKNTLQHLIEEGNNVINRTLTKSFNQSTETFVKSVKDFPHQVMRNTLCAVPYLARKLRQSQVMENPSILLRRHFKNVRRRSGN